MGLPDRLTPVSTTPGTIAGNAYMDAVQDEITGLWNFALIKLTGATGTNSITATCAPALTGALSDGMHFELVPANTTTSATVTLDVGTGAFAVVDQFGAALDIADLVANGHYIISWDSVLTKFVVLSYLPPLAFVDRPGFRNFIDNGGFELWQRGAGDSAAIAVSASNSPGAYTADRWYCLTNANQACVVSAQPGLTSQSRLCARVLRNASQTDSGGGAIVFAYPLTTEECYRLRGQKVTLSFVAKAGANWSPASGTLNYAFLTGTGTEQKRPGGGFTSEDTNISSSANLTASPSAATTVQTTSSGTVPTDVTQGEVRFSWTPTTTAGADDSISFDDVQLEVAATATEFERIPFVECLQRCQRHYAKTFPYGTAPAQAAGLSNAICGKDDSQPWQNFLTNNGGVVSGIASMQMVGFAANWHFPVRMRTSPSITTFNPISAAASWREPTGNSGGGIDVTAAINPGGNGGDIVVTITADGGNRNANLGSMTETLAYIHATADASL